MGCAAQFLPSTETWSACQAPHPPKVMACSSKGALCPGPGMTMTSIAQVGTLLGIVQHTRPSTSLQPTLCYDLNGKQTALLTHDLCLAKGGQWVFQPAWAKKQAVSHRLGSPTGLRRGRCAP